METKTTPLFKRDRQQYEQVRGESHINRLRKMAADDHAVEKLLPWTIEFAKENGRYPTRRETQAGLDLSSVSLVANRISYLVAIGKLCRSANGRISVPGYRFTLVKD